MAAAVLEQEAATTAEEEVVAAAGAAPAATISRDRTVKVEGSAGAGATIAMPAVIRPAIAINLAAI